MSILGEERTAQMQAKALGSQPDRDKFLGRWKAGMEKIEAHKRAADKALIFTREGSALIGQAMKSLHDGNTATATYFLEEGMREYSNAIKALKL